ncbi:hypothetical protein SEPCBS57363_003640 [Sporothrix epigloea]|uniref:DUF3752 domain-containing protein n=1 Tax=Sporothrix epigloea TaxID=1892477 RepID=A0ABP0DPD4_9PEZI
MSQIGPAMPAHLIKRKREADGDADRDDGRRVRHASSVAPGPTSAGAAIVQGPTLPPPRAGNADEIDLSSSESDDDTTGPTLPPSIATASKIQGPNLPPQQAVNEDEIDLDCDNSDSDDAADPAPLPARASQPARKIMGPTMGPTMPPLPDSKTRFDTRSNDAKSEGGHSDSDDSDYGPALPRADNEYSHKPVADATDGLDSKEADTAVDPYSAAPSQRDDWMLAPPSDNTVASLAADPTKIRARGFATGRAAAAASGGAASSAIGSLWTETLQQKSQRLADTVLGRAADPRQGAAAASTGPNSASSAAIAAANAGRNSRIRAYTESTRGKSLYETHQESLESGRTKKGKDRVESRDRNRERCEEKIRDRHEEEERPQRSQDSDRHGDRDRIRDRDRHTDRDRHRDNDRHRDRDRDRDDKDRIRRREDKDRHRRHHHDRHDRHVHHSRDERDKDSQREKSKSKFSAQVEDDDPSARAFDREKDMRIGVQITNKQRRDLVSRAGDFSGRFSKGSFL